MLVASITANWWREDMAQSTILGIYQHVSPAVQAIARVLFDRYYIMENFEDEEFINLPKEEVQAKKLALVALLKTKEDLKKLCDDFGDSYQGQTWNWKLEAVPIFNEE